MFPSKHVEPVLERLPDQIADMLRLRLLTAMRPGEVCKMRVGDIKKKDEFGNYHRYYSAGIWLHSDRGVPFSSEMFRWMGLAATICFKHPVNLTTTTCTRQQMWFLEPLHLT